LLSLLNEAKNACIMSRLSGQEIRSLARQLVLQRPGGIRYGELVEEIRRLHPDTPHGTVMGNINGLETAFSEDIAKPARGLYVARTGLPPTPPPPAPPNRVTEADFYEPFASYLKSELDEVTDAVSIGGSFAREKWHTPDVLGVYRPTSADLIRFQPEIVAAEVKIDPSQTVVAFGQAVAYRLFANASYLVLPRTIEPEERVLLFARCRLAGIGLVLFDLDPAAPKFETELLAVSAPTDMFHTNRFAELLHRASREKYERLFG
jgi:hypothetical protein